MNQWKVFTRDPIDQPELSHELNQWVGKNLSGQPIMEKVLFREGATISEIVYASNSLVCEAELEPLQIVRLFCPLFELYARRYSFDGSGVWQLRIASVLGDLPDGVPIKHEGTTQVHLLGDQPERYRRASFEYPNLNGQDCRCVLEANLFSVVTTNNPYEPSDPTECADSVESDLGPTESDSTYEEGKICCWTAIKERTNSETDQEPV